MSQCPKKGLKVTLSHSEGGREGGKQRYLPFLIQSD